MARTSVKEKAESVVEPDANIRLYEPVLNLLEKMISQYGPRISTMVLVLLSILIVMLLDYTYYAIIEHTEMYDGWFYEDAFLTIVVGAPFASLLLSLIAKSHLQQAALNAALSQVKELKALLPMCAACKKIRDEDGEWYNLDEYIRDHTNSTVSHGLCPDCKRSMYGGSVK